MTLSERKKKILAAIVEIFIQTGEPVGSKLLVEYLGMPVSSATIRSDMAWLFEMGYLEQPHTSAGRVPSHLGYREYIDSIMRCDPLSQEERDEIDSLFNVRNPDPDRLLADTAQALASYTNCATIASTYTPKTVRVSRIDLIAAGTNTVVIIVIATNGMIRSKVCRVDFILTPKLIEFFINFINSRLSGKSLDSISSEYISSASVSLGEYSRIFTPILVSIYELCKEINDGHYFLSGGTRLLEYREFEQVARDLLDLLGQKEKVQELITSDTGISVTIGKENQPHELINSSVLVTHYDVGGQRAGAVAVVGPIRINYARIIPHLEYFAKTLGELLSETLEPRD
ncbi:heat-inducible transcriptional repressor HrcA [Oscillospiraceae bacterium MB08-C2-2]|nr:heat-inducible transcriptional repressor HrcA [Oscillospiraceae bacterium MB08-C2-2]